MFLSGWGLSWFCDMEVRYDMVVRGVGGKRVFSGFKTEIELVLFIK